VTVPERRELDDAWFRELAVGEPARVPDGVDPEKFRGDLTYFARRFRQGLGHYNGVLERLDFIDRERALDIGSGAGQWSIALGHRNRSVEGIELRKDFVEIARRLTRDAGLEDRVRYRIGAAESCSYPDAHFELVFCHGVLMFTDHEALLTRVARWTAPDGLFYCAYTTRGARLAGIVKAIAGGNLRVAEGQLAILIGDALFRCGVRCTFGSRVRAHSHEELLEACDVLGFQFLESPDVQDGARFFLGLPRTFDLLCRRRTDGDAGRSGPAIAGSDVPSAVRRMIDLGLPATALVELARTDALLDAAAHAELNLRARLKLGEPLDTDHDHQLLERLQSPARELLPAIASHAAADFEGAIGGYEQLPDDHPDRTFLIGACLTSLKRFDEALELLGRADDACGDPLPTWALKVSATLSSWGTAGAVPLVRQLVALLDREGAHAEEAERLLTALGP
jgi:SAM-dependent methyltransferase